MSKILIVDDDSVFRDFLSELCKLEGHTVFHAANGPEALTQLGYGARNGKPRLRPEMMIVDFNMDGMSGFDLIRRL